MVHPENSPGVDGAPKGWSRAWELIPECLGQAVFAERLEEGGRTAVAAQDLGAGQSGAGALPVLLLDDLGRGVAGDAWHLLDEFIDPERAVDLEVEDHR